MKHIKPKMVEVTWDDAASHSAWRDMEDADKTDVDVITTLGHLLSKDKRRLRVAMNISGYGNVSDILNIPTSCVKKIRRLR
jgi:hypothetical protein